MSTVLATAPVLAQDATPTQPSLAQPGASEAVSDSGSGQAAGVADIVVTAQRREQSLQDVPISITALNQTTILANRIQDVRDLNAIAPNLTVRFSAGGSQIPNFTLRGLFTSGTGAGTDKGVALYLDGVYIQSVIGSVFDFADIERIEVLKGPQGTLFGRNSTGGAISITTRNPTGEFGAQQDLTYGNYNQLRSKTRLDLPQLGPFSATITYLHSERRGDIRNLGAGTTYDFGPATGGRDGRRTSPKYLGSDNIEAVQATLKADLLDGLDLIYKFDYSQNNYTPVGQGNAYVPAGGLIRALYDLSPNPKTPISEKRPKAVNNAYSQRAYLDSLGHNFTATYQLTDQITLKNILAYRKSALRNNYQLDGLGGLVNLPLVPIGGGRFLPVGAALTPAVNSGDTTLVSANTAAPFAIIVNNTFNRENQWSDEFQVNIDTDWFTVTAGYLHFYNKQRTGGAPDLFNTSLFTAFAGQNTTSPNTPFVIPANPGFISTIVKVKSDAWFMQPEFHITDQLDLILGARITKDKKDGFEIAPNQFVASRPSADFPAGRPRPVTTTVRYRDSEASVLVGVNYRPTSEILLYAKYADGYISGGQLATIAYAPERAFSYEGGLKADLFDRRFRSNLAVFHVDYKAIQSTTTGASTGIPSSFLFGQAVISAADAKADGFEWENTLVPVSGVTLTANVGYTDFKFDQDTLFPGFALQAGAPGYKEFARPKWTGSFAAQYDSPEFFQGGHLTARVDANFRSKQLLAADLTLNTGPTDPEDPGIRRAATTPFTWLVNGRLGLVDLDVGFTKASVALWGRNLFDNKQILQYAGIPFGALGYIGPALYERARTYGVDVSLRF